MYKCFGAKGNKIHNVYTRRTVHLLKAIGLAMTQFTAQGMNNIAPLSVYIEMALTVKTNTYSCIYTI
jgi:hypothetical protein